MSTEILITYSGHHQRWSKHNEEVWKRKLRWDDSMLQWRYTSRSCKKYVFINISISFSILSFPISQFSNLTSFLTIFTKKLTLMSTTENAVYKFFDIQKVTLHFVQIFSFTIQYSPPSVIKWKNKNHQTNKFRPYIWSIRYQLTIKRKHHPLLLSTLCINELIKI